MNQSKFLAITCNSLKAQQNSHTRAAIGFSFAFHWLENWCEIFDLNAKPSNRNHVITFDSNLKTTLSCLQQGKPNLERVLFLNFVTFPQ